MINVLMKSSARNSFGWESDNNIFVRGYAYIGDKYYKADELITFFSKVKDERALKHLANELNGLFAVIIVNDESVFAAVDRYGVFKLFYAGNNNGLFIGDDVDGIAKAAGFKMLNKKAVKDWYYSGFAAENDTLIDGVFSINASECFSFTDITKALSVEKYHSFKSFSDNKKVHDQFLKEMQNIVKGAAARLADSLNGKRVLIPLSGGVDSRFCAMLLKMIGYEKVTCFSYGNRNGREERIAAVTARQLGFEHIFIPYKYRDWANLFKAEENLKYIDSFAQYKATPHFSDLFAARFLAEKYNPGECIIVPGHIGSIAESAFDNNKEYNSGDVINKLIKKYFYFYGDRHAESIKYLQGRLDTFIPKGITADAGEAQGIFDNAAYDTYRSNHLFMALKPYEFYDFEWRLPLMDRDIVEFFKTVPLTYKSKTKILLCDFVAKNCCNSVPFFKEPQTYLQKVIRNIADRRYSCINPFIIYKFKTEWDIMPPFYKVIYRFYRNYLSYVSLKTLKILLKKIKNI